MEELWCPYGSREQDYRVIQPGPVITRRTRDPRAPPVVSNFSICSCTYTCVRARANMDGVGPCFARFTAAETDFSVFLHRFSRGWMRCFFHRNDREPIDRFVLFPFPSPRCTTKRFLVLPFFFLRIKRGDFENDGKRAFENFLANRLALILDWDLWIKF